jgi:hypothetical protein
MLNAIIRLSLQYRLVMLTAVENGSAGRPKMVALGW